MSQEKSNLIDISSDIVMSGIILSFILVFINKEFGPKETGILISYLACSSIWKISSPFNMPNKIGRIQYFWIIILLILMILIPVLFLGV